MAFPTTSELDNFNRDENPLSTNWTTYLAALQSVAAGGFCTRVTDNEHEGAYRNNATYGPDAEAWAVVLDPGNLTSDTGLLSLAVRWDTANDNKYAIDCPRFRVGAGTHEWRFKEVTGGVETQLGASIIQDVAAGDSVGVEIIGTTLAAYYKSGAGAWGQLGTRTPNTSYPNAGRIGIHALQTVAVTAPPELDSFGGGTVVVASLVLGAPSPPVTRVRLRAY